MRRAPDIGDLGVLGEKGRVKYLEVETGDGMLHRYTWKGRDRPLLLWSPRARALVWFEGAEIGRRKKGAPRSDGAARIWEDFAEGREADSHRIANLPPRKLRKVGRAAQIGYTEPWGRAPAGTLHYHDFGPSDVFWAADRAAPYVFAVTGPRLTVTERGIVY